MRRSTKRFSHNRNHTPSLRHSKKLVSFFVFCGKKKNQTQYSTALYLREHCCPSLYTNFTKSHCSLNSLLKLPYSVSFSISEFLEPLVSVPFFKIHIRFSSFEHCILPFSSFFRCLIFSPLKSSDSPILLYQFRLHLNWFNCPFQLLLFHFIFIILFV